MHRFYLPPEASESKPLFLTGGEAHHALKVLRLRRGDRITVLNGAGAEFICEIEKSAHQKAELQIVEKTTSDPPPYTVTLLQALPKGKLFESIVQKGTELGVFRIVPLISKRVVVAPADQEAAKHKLEKWRMVAIEAIKQCGLKWLPQIELPILPQQFLSRNERFDLSLLAALQGETKHPRTYFRQFRERCSRNPHSLSIWIGPEGDFTHQEVDL